MRFTCLHCGRNTPFIPGVQISLICQSCGKDDLAFDERIERIPISGGDRGLPEVVESDIDVCGRHANGRIWIIKTAPPKEELGDGKKRKKDLEPPKLERRKLK